MLSAPASAHGCRKRRRKNVPAREWFMKLSSMRSGRTGVDAAGSVIGTLQCVWIKGSIVR
jgi:hypothetical protein